MAPRKRKAIAEYRQIRRESTLCLGYSTKHNRRNIEYDWYPAYTVQFESIMPTRGDFSLAPQYHVYLDPNDPEACGGDVEDGDDDEAWEDVLDPEHGLSDAQRSHTSGGNAMDVDKNVAEPENGGLDGDDDLDISTASTLPASRGTASQTTDFAVLHMHTVALRPTDTPTHPDGTSRTRRLRKATAVILVEVKRYISRRIICTMRKLSGKLQAAQKQLIRQAAHVFAQRDVEKLRLIAGVGPWWTTAVVKRNPSGPQGPYQGERLNDYYSDGKINEELVERGIVWDPVIRRLFTKESDAQFAIITQELKDMPKSF